MTTSWMTLSIAAVIAQVTFEPSSSLAAMRSANEVPEALRCQELVNRPDGPTDGQCGYDGRAVEAARYQVSVTGGVILAFP